MFGKVQTLEKGLVKEEAFWEVKSERTKTDMLCPVCIGKEMDNYLYESNSGGYICHRCERTLPPAEWMGLYSFALGPIDEEVRRLRTANRALQDECDASDAVIAAMRRAVEEAA